MCVFSHKALMKIQEGEGSYRVRAVAIKPRRTICWILGLKKQCFLFIYPTWRIRGAQRTSSRSFCTGSSRQSRTQLYPCSNPVEIYMSDIMIQVGLKVVNEEKDRGTISSDTLWCAAGLYLCAPEVPHGGWWNEYCTYKEFGKSTKIICNIYMYGFLEKYEEQFYSNWSKIRKIMDIHYALPEGQRENYIFKTFWNSTFLSLFENTLSNPLLKSVQE